MDMNNGNIDKNKGNINRNTDNMDNGKMSMGNMDDGDDVAYLGAEDSIETWAMSTIGEKGRYDRRVAVGHVHHR